MKIAFINFTYGKKTGIENVADNIMRHIDKSGVEDEYILIINQLAQNFYRTSRIAKKEIKAANMQILKTLWLLFIYPFYALIKGIRVTIIFSGTSNFAFSPFTKNIIYIHDLGEMYIKDKYDKKRMIYRKYVTLPINKWFGDVFIAVSESTVKAIADKLGLSREKIKLIYNATDDRIRIQKKEDARKRIAEKYKIRDSDSVLITIGRIDPLGKNLIRLVKAIDICRKTCKNFHLFLVGDTNFINSHLVPLEIQKRNLGEYITLTGYADFDDLNCFYNGADLLVFPSLYEGFGLPLLEAMKCDLPVACSDIEVFHEVADDAALYFNPLDYDDMAEKIFIGLNNQSVREELIKKGRIRESTFSWEDAAKELMQVVHNLCS